MSSPANDSSSQLQDCNENKTEAKPLVSESAFDVKRVSDDGKSCNTNTAGCQFINHLYQNAGVERSDGFNASVHEEGAGGKAFVKISVPVKNGHTTVNVCCKHGTVEDMRYTFKHFDKEYPKHLTKLCVKQVPGIVDTMQTHNEVFFDAVETLEERYEATLTRFSEGCLFLEFEHASEEKAKAMVADVKNVQKILKDFAQNCGLPADNVRVEAEYEIVETPGLTQKKDDPIPDRDRVVRLRTKEKESQPVLEDGLTQKYNDPIPGRDRAARLTTQGKKRKLSGSSGYIGLTQKYDDPIPGRDRMVMFKGKKKIRQCRRSSGYRGGTIPSFHLDAGSDLDTKFSDVARQLCALRNSGGGQIKLFMVDQEEFIDRYDSFVYMCLDACLLDDELSDDVYTTKEEIGVKTIDAYLSTELITVDYNTKILFEKRLLNPTRRQMISLMHRRRSLSSSVAQVRGRTCALKEGKTVFKHKNQETVNDTFQFVKRLFVDLKLREYICAFSKNKYGGSYFLELELCDNDKQEVTSALNNHIIENFVVLEASQGLDAKWSNPPYDLITLSFQSFECMENKYSMEVSVRPFSGIVFYEKTGPESYGMNREGQPIRLTKEEWLNRMSK